MTTIGEKIHYLRKLSGMSQEELGKRIGVQRAAINKYEKGTVENIPIKSIEQIARVFDVSPTYIVGWCDADSNPLSAEVKILRGVKNFYGGESVDLLEGFVQLDQTGKKRVQLYVEDMLRIHNK